MKELCKTLLIMIKNRVNYDRVTGGEYLSEDAYRMIGTLESLCRTASFCPSLCEEDDDDQYDISGTIWPDKPAYRGEAFEFLGDEQLIKLLHEHGRASDGKTLKIEIKQVRNAG